MKNLDDSTQIPVKWLTGFAYAIISCFAAIIAIGIWVGAVSTNVSAVQEDLRYRTTIKDKFAEDISNIKQSQARLEESQAEMKREFDILLGRMH